MKTQETWPCCPEASAFFESLLDEILTSDSSLRAMTHRFLVEGGVRIQNLVDHWALPDSREMRTRLALLGIRETRTCCGEPVWEHPGARLPRVRLETGLAAPRIALGVESLVSFAEANDLPVQGQHGDPDSGYEEVRYAMSGGELAVLVRQGTNGFQPGELAPQAARGLARLRGALSQRRRDGSEAEVLSQTAALLTAVADELGVDRATDEFFAAEREYYLTRNAAARWQYERQCALGFGWGNHDHHTYRSSRAGFRALMQLFQQLGFAARERFYAGAEAGWGAQIFDHPVSRVVIFADVDIAPDEIDIDFSTSELPPTVALGTIGLWCALHGSSIGRAGMHHIECEYDFDQARSGLQEAAFGVMPPFTDMPVLKQAFSAAEVWPVAPERISSLLALGSITEAEAEQFRTHGAPGSHIEILQRWEGFKGFNKTGVSSIIRDTDARR